MTPRYFAY